MDKATEMSIFCQTVDEKSFSAAARRLHLTPSAVSKQITRLEDRLGVRLFNRSTRRLNLTEEGRTFYERSRAILAEIDDAERAVTDARSTPRGTLKINASVSFGRRQLVPLMPHFMAAYPDLNIELELSDRTVNLLEEGVDVLLRIGELNDSSHVARRLAVIHRYICASPSYLSRCGVPQQPADLVNHNCLTLNVQSSYNEWTFTGPDGQQRIQVHGNFSSNIGGALYAAAMAGLGIARLATFVIGPDIESGRLVPLLTEYTDDDVPLYAVYPHRRHVSPKVRAFVDYMLEQFSPQPPWETHLCKTRSNTSGEVALP